MNLTRKKPLSGEYAQAGNTTERDGGIASVYDAELSEFLETGRATDGFLRFIEANADVRRQVEDAFAREGDAIRKFLDQSSENVRPVALAREFEQVLKDVIGLEADQRSVFGDALAARLDAAPAERAENERRLLAQIGLLGATP